MLVLSRKKTETIVIGGNITITILEIADNKCRIGIDAPENIKVHRGEVQAEINAESLYQRMLSFVDTE